MASNSKSSGSQKKSTQDWIPVQDIKNNLVYMKTGSIVAAVHITPVNLNLLSFEEKKRRINRLEVVFNGIDYPFQFFSIGRPVDLDEYIAGLEWKRKQTEDEVKKTLISLYAKQAAVKAMSGEALERHFYMLIDAKLGKKPQMDEQLLLEKAKQLSSNLTGAELISHVCNDQDLRTMNFIFSNPAHAAFERAPEESYIPTVIYMEDQV